MNDSQDTYDGYTQFYDEIIGDRSARIKRIQGYIHEYAPQCHSVLEVACGTGSILAGLDPAYKVAGLDASASMLQVAQQKLPRASYFHGDMANFWLNQQFDVVYCTFNAINVLSQFEQWQRMFACVAAHLNAGGIFIFDTNTKERMETLALAGSWSGDLPSGISVVTRVSPVPDTDNAWQWNISIVHQGGEDFQVTTKEFVSTVFPPEQIKAELEKNFTVLNVVTDKGNPFQQEDADRTYYICKKNDAGTPAPTVISPSSTAAPAPGDVSGDDTQGTLHLR